MLSVHAVHFTLQSPFQAQYSTTYTRGRGSRIVQCKMIMKQVGIPMQDDHERRMKGCVLRPGANTHAERGEADSTAHQRDLERQRGNQLYGGEQSRSVQLGAECAGGTGVCQPEQGGAGIDPGLYREGDRAELPQATRLIRQYRETGMVGLQPTRRLRFPRKYTDRDITLLAEVDRHTNG